jgi:hypothetical protein
MTGDVTLHATGVGTWNVVHDSGAFGAQWNLVFWNRENCIVDPDHEVPVGTTLTFEARASDIVTELPSLPYVQVGRATGQWNESEEYELVQVGNGTWFNGVNGRYLELRVRFYGTLPDAAEFETPVLCDLTVTTATADMNCDGAVNTFDIDPFVLALSDPLAYATAFPLCNGNNGDVNCDGAVNTFDIDPFVACLTAGGCCCHAQ